MLATQLKSKIQSSILDIQEYIRAWSHYEQIWKSNRLPIVGRFAALSPNASTFDYVLSFFTATMDVLKDAHKEKMAIYTDIQADTVEAEALTSANDMSRPSRPSTTNRPEVLLAQAVRALPKIQRMEILTIASRTRLSFPQRGTCTFRATTFTLCLI